VTSAPLSQQRLLIDLQSLDSRLARLRHERKHLPVLSRIKATVERLKANRRAAALADGALAEARKGATRSEDEVAQVVRRAEVLRERADQDNLRKRFEREKESALKYGSEKLVRDLLPVLDSLTLGLDAAKAHEAEGKQALEQFIAGSAMTLKLLLETLEKNGITEINPVGEKLDPERHQALSAIPSPDAEPNTILHVAQKGYLLNGRVIRAAQVIVADGAQKNPPQS